MAQKKPTPIQSKISTMNLRTVFLLDGLGSSPGVCWTPGDPRCQDSASPDGLTLHRVAGQSKPQNVSIRGKEAYDARLPQLRTVSVP